MTVLWLWLLACVDDPPDSDAPVDVPDPTATTGDTGEDTVPAPVWTDGALATQVHGWSFHAEADPAGPATVSCVLADDATEVHTAGAPEAEIHDLVLFGLLAGATYDCTLAVGDAVEARAITTGPMPEGYPEWTTIGVSDGYTLLNHGTDYRFDRQAKLLIVDPEGRLRWAWDVPYQAADLDAQFLGDGRILFGGGYSAPPTVIDLLGVVELEAPPSSTGFAYHHHAERIETGEVATLTEGFNGDGTDWWNGFAVDLLDPTLTSRTWSWNSQRGFDEGWLPAGGAAFRDVYHANAIQVVGDDVYVNLRQQSMLVKLDRVTGDHDWTLGPGGDFALVDAAGAPDDPANWFYMPHAPEREGDRILFYDNGLGRPGGWFSRIVELEIDEAARTARVVWSYTEPGWYEPIWGDVDRLPSGRILFVRAHSNVSVPLLDYQRTEVVEVDPVTDTVVWRLSFLDLHDAGYRAERIDPCALFANQKYCPTP